MDKYIHQEYTNNNQVDEISNYTNMKVFNVTIILKLIDRLKNIFKIINEDYDVDIIILEVIYKTDNIFKFYRWEVYKTYKSMRNFFLSFNNLRNKGLISINNTELDYKINLILNLEIDEYKQRIELIINVLNIVTKYKHRLIFEFFEISRYSFNCFNDNNKPKEGYILKSSMSKKNKSCYIRYISPCFNCCVKWKKRWFVLKDDMICYLDTSSHNIAQDIFWFDQQISIIKDYEKTSNTMILTNGSRKLILKFDEFWDREIWFNEISKKLSEYQNSVKNIFNSFSYEKEGNAKWFVDADDYFQDLYNNLMKAQESIYIAGWWVSPELFLKRPVSDNYNNNSRLIDILKYKADHNIKVHILIYKEVKVAINVNSNHTKETFNKLNPNIKVTRHPKSNFELMWSHHEKIIIIDQRIGYVGGIDLCWGRYDNHKHKLCEEYNQQNLYYWPGIDYCNSRKKDFENLSKFRDETINRNIIPRMPWHDVSTLIEGPVVSDLTRHFVERWNFARDNSYFQADKKYTIVNVKSNSRSSSKYLIPSVPFIKFQTLENQLLKNTKLSVKNNHYFFKNSLLEEKLINNYNYESNIYNSKNLYTSDIIDEEVRYSLIDKIKGAFNNVKQKISDKSQSVKEYFKSLKDNENNEENMNIRINDKNTNIYSMKCQILRSASNWSVGLDKKDEQSILKAYYELIDNSKHYILIENQFFISKSYKDEETGNLVSSPIVNEIALHIRNRIEKAYEKKEKFRVIILIPLLPAFPGEINELATLHIILKYTYRTISRNKGLSLIEKLYQLMQDKLEDYISFFSMRTHDIINNIPKTELIYIHSKIMIIDDQIALIGSANINDRSMLGSRDSEIAVIIRDEKKITSYMDGQIYLASEYALNLRLRLFKEYLGFDINSNSDILLDPLSDELFEMMKNYARSNTLIYREIFNCYPDDNILKFENINENNSQVDIKEKYEKLKNDIRGYIVELPLNFLKEEKLDRTYFCKEILVPIKNFL